MVFCERAVHRHVVTVGAYRFIRHPLYASLLCFAWGAALKSLTPITAVLVALATGFLVATAKAEEVENLGRFGEANRQYGAHVALHPLRAVRTRGLSSSRLTSGVLGC